MNRVTLRIALIAVGCHAVALVITAHPFSAVRAADEAVANPLACGGQPCDAVVRGLRAFLDRKLHGLDGNGRSCADCHMPTDDFQLSPSSVELRFRLLQLRRRFNPEADDPLFRPVDADDFRTNGDAASDFSNLRQHALVRISLPLPPALRLVDPTTNLPSNETFVDVWRMVPTVNDVRLTGDDGDNPWPRGPNPTGGYQLDARFGTLQEQALGALLEHAQIQRAPPQLLLDDLAAFQLQIFSSPRVRALVRALDAGDPLPDPDPPLNALETEGRDVFQRACAQCHGGLGQTTTPFPIVRYHGIATQCPRPVDPVTPARWVFQPCPPQLERNVRVYQITQFNGTVTRRASSDPGRALLTGFVGGPPPFDDWNKFDVPALRGISRTAPYFHNNSAATLEEVVEHYVQLFNQIRANTPPGAPLPPVASTDGVNLDRQPQPHEVAALLAYLRKL